FQAKIARCFAFVGPHLPLDAHFAIGNFIRDAMNGTAIRVQGDGTPHRSYLYSADLAIWLWNLLFLGPSGRACNVGSGTELSIANVASLVAACGEKAGEVEIAQHLAKGGYPKRYVPDVSYA